VTPKNEPITRLTEPHRCGPLAVERDEVWLEGSQALDGAANVEMLRMDRSISARCALGEIRQADFVLEQAAELLGRQLARREAGSIQNIPKLIASASVVAPNAAEREPAAVPQNTTARSGASTSGRTLRKGSVAKDGA
jgi:hypothetical protein